MRAKEVGIEPVHECRLINSNFNDIRNLAAYVILRELTVRCLQTLSAVIVKLF